MAPASDLPGVPATLANQLQQNNQEHILDHLSEFEPPHQQELIQQLEGIDLVKLAQIFQESIAPALRAEHSNQTGSSQEVAEIQPVKNVSTISGRTDAEKERWNKLGLEAIAKGEVAILLLAGGQGTRLGSDAPKGCFNIGLPSSKSLFQLQAERIRRLQELATGGGEKRATIPWYILTSPFTHQPSQAFFKEHNYFGLPADQVIFFQQGTLPCLDRTGRLILATPSTLATAPDGNGGVFLALKSSGCLADISRRGVRYIDCFSVDNALVRVAEPTWIGHCIERGAAAGARVLRKAHPQEKVGVFVQRGEGGPVEVVEYSEMEPAQVAATDPETEELRFSWSNICMHFFTTAFLAQAAAALEQSRNYHVAFKSIPSITGPTPGCKLEQFIFDVFPLAGQEVALLEVARSEEFSPVKNAPGSPSDSPDTARAHVLTLHKRWVEAAGGQVDVQPGTDASGVEVSPLISYAGEGLAELVAGRSFVAGREII